MKLLLEHHEQAIILLCDEYGKALTKFPFWPDDIYEGYAILAEEVGEIAQALLDFKYKGGSLDSCITEAAQSGAMCLRILQQLLLIKESRL